MRRARSGSPGGVVAIYGPDGAGKSALADTLVQRLPGEVLRIHHRPRVLPGRTLGGVPVTDPHREPPYRGAIALVKLAYLFVDHLLGWLLRVRPVRRRGWVVIERSWWDLAVDPRRYRLRSSQLVGWFGRLLPSPDLTVVLDAPADVLLARKREIDRTDLERQLAAWRQLAGARGWLVVDAAATPEAVSERVLAELTEGIAGGRYGHVGMPNPLRPRILVPRAPRRAACEGLLIEQPSAPMKMVAWRVLRVAASAGVFRLLPRSRDGLEAERARLRAHLPRGGHLAVARSQRAGSGYVALLLDRGGHPTALAKCATDEKGRRTLAREADAVRELAPHLRPPVSAPRLLDVEEDLLLWEAVCWRPRPHPWRPPADVLRSVGTLFEVDGGSERGGAHGDFAPWNLLRTDGGWALIDWADAGTDLPAFHDVLHYLVQSHAALGRPTAEVLLDGVRYGRGWTGAAIRAYADGAGIDAASAPRHFVAYLERSGRSMDPTDPRFPDIARARDRLHAAAVASMPARWPAA